MSQETRDLPVAEHCEFRTIDVSRVQTARAGMPDRGEIDAMVELFKALGDPTRARIVYALLAAGELCVCDLAAVVEAPESTVSHALRWLRTAGVVSVRRSGKMMYYALGDESVARLLGFSREHRHERSATGHETPMGHGP